MGPLTARRPATLCSDRTQLACLLWLLCSTPSPPPATTCHALQEEQARLQRQGLSPPEASGSESDPEDSPDLRWRHVCFSSAAPRWQRRLASLRAVLEARGAEFGCWVDQQGGWGAPAAGEE